MRVKGEEEGAPPGVPPHREHPRVVGVQNVPSIGTRDACDRRLHLRELFERVDAVEPQMIAGDVRDDGNVVVRRADTPQEDASARRLEDRDIDAGLSERGLGSGESGIVAGLHEGAVAVDAVG
jgi:hypothetical protein